MTRKDDKFLNVMIRDSSANRIESLIDNQEDNFYMFEASALNTANKIRALELVNKGNRLDKIIKIQSFNLLQLAERIMTITPDFAPDFVNIDLEKSNILLDLPEFLILLKKPELICLEWISDGYSLRNYQSSPEFDILDSVDYEIEALIGGNIFAKSRVKNLR